MNMLKQAFRLLKSERTQKGSTLQRRLILFFFLVIVGILTALLLLLTVFGITGSGENAVRSYVDTELAHFSTAIKTDLGNLSVTGIALSETLSERSDGYFAENGIYPSQLRDNPEHIEPLLSEMMPDILSVAQNNSCGGVFVLLDATVNQNPDLADTAKAGIFIKKTQPVSSGAVKGRAYCLRGPAEIARSKHVELLGQWRMEYDISGQDFFNTVMETARANPELSVSRLYYWSESITIKGNSEAGYLLCVPLRADDGTVFGVCGIEVSELMFRQLYSPQSNEDYPHVTTVAAFLTGKTLHTQTGLAGGGTNSVHKLLSGDLTFEDEGGSFAYASGQNGSYGGLTQQLAIYPKDSPYISDAFFAAVLMPREDLETAVRGNSAYLFIIVLVLFVLSTAASVFVSRRYLRPIIKMFNSVKNKQNNGEAFNISEIDEFFEALAQQSKEQSELLQSAQTQKQKAEEKFASAQKLIEQLSTEKVKGFDPDRYAMFCEGIKHLTKTQREIFLLYLEGCSLSDVRERGSFTKDALKWHNREIYAKLGVSSLKELMVYAPVIKMDMERGTKH